MKQIYYFLFLLTGLLSACHDGYDDRKNISPPGEVTAESWLEVTFNMQLPSQSTNISTYGLTENDETAIEHVDVLAFLQDAGKEYFAYQTEATVIQDAENNKKKFTVKVKRSDALHRFVILANCHTEVEGLGALSTTQEKEDILESLIHTHANAWQEGETIPMWGESDAVAITNSTSSIATIQIIRMLARIDVFSPLDESKFKIEEIHFFHHNTSGHIVPASNNFDVTSQTALLPTVPDNPGRATTAQAYMDATNNYIRGIYAFETDSALPSSQHPCIVIGGSYNGGGTTYYKVAFINEDEEELPIVRNHLYTVKITDIAGEGYSTADAACDSKAINISASVLVWNQGILTNIVYDDEYMLGVSQNLYEVPKDAKEYAVIVTTDYPDCWKAEVTEGSQWITLEAVTTCTGSYKKDEFKFNVEVNNSGQERTGIITITAGHLVQVLEIVQGVKSSLDIIIVDKEDTPINQLNFETFLGMTPLETKEFIVKWEPETSVYTVGYTYPGSYPFNFGIGDNPLTITPVAGGSKSFSITPPVIQETELDLSEDGNSFIAKRIQLSFSVTDENSTTVSDQIELIQQVYGVFGYPEASYTMDGSSYTFKVKSNVEWTAEVVPGGIVSSIQTTQGGPNETGEDFTFTIINGDGNGLDNPGQIKFTFTTPEGKTGVTYVDINGLNVVFRDGVLSNCYILEPGSEGIRIPVKQANRDKRADRIGEFDELDWEIIWIDDDQGISMEGVISSVSVSGVGYNGYVNVAAGKTPGNALVGVKVDNKIRWSWHIWVTDYNPDTTTIYNNQYKWMDRNLGALTNKVGDHKTIGLVYQWGRKDPFPGLDNFNEPSPFPIYDAHGNGTTTLFHNVDNNDYLEESIENPKTFMLGSSANYYDWFGVNTGDNQNDLWFDGVEKTMYDPCPEGWIVAPDQEIAFNWYVGNYTLVDNGAWINGAYWPYVGNRSHLDGLFIEENIGKQGYYYFGNSVTWNTNYGYKFTGLAANLYIQEQRNIGASVRCMQEYR